MKLKGIARGDHGFRHFTFDDEDVILKNNVYYYKVNYGKNPLEGEYGEEEIGYVPCENVMCIGGKKPRPVIMKEEPKPEVVEQKTSTVSEPVVEEPKKRGRPSKKVQESVSTYTGDNTFEYIVEEFHTSEIPTFQSQLNEKGKEGWELCGFDSTKSLFGEIDMIAIFKRKRG